MEKGKEPLMHVIKYEIFSILRSEGFEWSEQTKTLGKFYRHIVVAHYQEYSLYIIRNYRDMISRTQSISVVDLDDNIIFECMLVGDSNICDKVAEAITEIKIRCRA